MASRRRIHGGKSFGRGQAIISFAIDEWEELGSWCLLHGVKDNIWKMPCYQLPGLVRAFLIDDKSPEDIKKIDRAFEQSDLVLHPFYSGELRALVKTACGLLTVVKPKQAMSIDNVIYDSRLVELPIEERKRREAQAKGKPYRVPEWWRGEQANYQIAKKMMVTLPKKGKQPVKDD